MRGRDVSRGETEARRQEARIEKQEAEQQRGLNTEAEPETEAEAEKAETDAEAEVEPSREKLAEFCEISMKKRRARTR